MPKTKTSKKVAASPCCTCVCNKKDKQITAEETLAAMLFKALSEHLLTSNATHDYRVMLANYLARCLEPRLREGVLMHELVEQRMNVKWLRVIHGEERTAVRVASSMHEKLPYPVREHTSDIAMHGGNAMVALQYAAGRALSNAKNSEGGSRDAAS